jgi:GT2 family glycosyltransferase
LNSSHRSGINAVCGGNWAIVLLSAVLPTYNRAAALRANLDSLLAVDGLDEIVVVDDGSGDNTWRWLRTVDDPRLRLLRRGCNCGSPSARNLGAVHASGDWVLFAEDDCRFPPDYAQVLLDEALRHPADIVGAPMVHLDTAPELDTALTLARRAEIGANGLDGVAGFPPASIETPLLPAPALVRRAVLDRLRFDEGYRGNAYREETDFFVRAVRAGFTCLLTPRTFFWDPQRFPGGQPRSAVADLWALHNNWRFLRRHGDWLVAAGYISSPMREQLGFAARRLRELLKRAGNGALMSIGGVV